MQRIFKHMLERGWIQPGDTCFDPFGGVGLGGVTAAYLGVRWVGIELEPKFFDIARENFQKHRRNWETLGCPHPVILNGDSRRAVELVRDHCDSVVSSPPYANEDVTKNSKSIDRQKQYETYRKSGGGASFEAFCATQDKHSGHYGSSDGQLASLPAGTVDAAVSSPPFGAAQTSTEQSRKQKESGYFAASTNGTLTGTYAATPMTTPGQLGLLDASVSSPPYANPQTSPPYEATNLNPQTDPEATIRRLEAEGKHAEAASVRKNNCGPANNMRQTGYDAAVSSPPYEDSLHPNESAEDDVKRLERKGLHGTLRRYGKNSSCGNKGYVGLTDSAADSAAAGGVASSPAVAGDRENLGNEQGETFWSAARLILLQTHALLKPGAIACFVLKDYIRNKKKVRFSEQWATLCVACGFEVVEWVKASLVKKRTHIDAFGEEQVEKTERKSFFRRLYESRMAEDDERRIDHEDVVFVRKIARMEESHHGQADQSAG